MFYWILWELSDCVKVCICLWLVILQLCRDGNYLVDSVGDAIQIHYVKQRI